MNLRARIKGLVLLLAVAATVTGSMVLLASSSVEAGTCRCWVTVCSPSPPYACYEQCKPCPKKWE